MRTASQRVGQDEKQEILDLLENSAINFTNAELDRSRLRKIRDNQDNFDLEIWRKIGALGWLDLLSTDENEINFIARAVKLIAYHMGTKGAPEPFMECGIGPLSLLNGSTKNLEFTDSGPPEKMIPFGFKLRSSLGAISDETISDKTPISLILLAIS